MKKVAGIFWGTVLGIFAGTVAGMLLFMFMSAIEVSIWGCQ